MLEDMRAKEVEKRSRKFVISAIMVYIEFQNRVRAKTCISTSEESFRAPASGSSWRSTRSILPPRQNRLYDGYCDNETWNRADQRFLLPSSKLGEASLLFWLCGGLEELLMVAAPTTTWDPPSALSWSFQRFCHLLHSSNETTADSKLPKLI